MDRHQTTEARKSKIPFWEPGPGYRRALTDFGTDVNFSAVITGIIPVAVLVFTVGAVFIELLSKTTLTQAEQISWIAIVYILGGVLSLILAPFYKQPIVGAWSIPGMFVVVEALNTVSYQEAVGGFLIAGVIVLVLGATGIITLVLRFIPVPILTAMVAGVLLSFPLNIIEGFRVSVLVATAGVIGYVIFQAIPRMTGILGTIIIGGVVAGFAGQFGSANVGFEVATFNVPGYGFSLAALLSVAIPLAVLVVGAENMQATGVLQTLRMRPPVNAMTTISGIGGILTSIFGGHNANIAGPTTATCGSPEAGPIKGRYTAAILAGLVFIAYGVFAPVMVQLTGLFPEALTLVLVGIVILPIVGRSLMRTFRTDEFLLGGMTAFIVAASDFDLFSIASPFWALVFGTLMSLTVETRHYISHVKGGGEEKKTEAREDKEAAAKTEPQEQA